MLCSHKKSTATYFLEQKSAHPYAVFLLEIHRSRNQFGMAFFIIHVNMLHIFGTTKQAQIGLKHSRAALIKKWLQQRKSLVMVQFCCEWHPEMHNI